ncbi:unnamed protein product [Rhizophagus irregularis]|nr:unnamed protein product [Rhizophagus irregularis]
MKFSSEIDKLPCLDTSSLSIFEDIFLLYISWRHTTHNRRHTCLGAISGGIAGGICPGIGDRSYDIGAAAAAGTLNDNEC